jgi:putative DNA primase/helicase
VPNKGSVTAKAEGRWRDILSMVGIDQKFLTKKNGPCPMCGGKDRFRYTDLNGKGTWVCNECGRGGGIALVMKFKSMDFKAAAKLVEPLIANAQADRIDSKLPDDEAYRRMRRAWTLSKPIVEGSLAWRYMESRRIAGPFPEDVLREVDGEAGGRMLAKVVDPQGKPVNIHRTILGEGAVKLDRKMMQGGVPPGSAIRLMEPSEGVLGIGEGIETCYSAAKLFQVPTWALINAEGLAAFQPPPDVVRCLIFGDNDASGHGQWAAWCAARNCYRAGVLYEVHIPARVAEDWNDVDRQWKRSS